MQRRDEGKNKQAFGLWDSDPFPSSSAMLGAGRQSLALLLKQTQVQVWAEEVQGGHAELRRQPRMQPGSQEPGSSPFGATICWAQTFPGASTVNACAPGRKQEAQEAKEGLSKCLLAKSAQS